MGVSASCATNTARVCPAPSSDRPRLGGESVEAEERDIVAGAALCRQVGQDLAMTLANLKPSPVAQSTPTMIHRTSSAKPRT